MSTDPATPLHNFAVGQKLANLPPSAKNELLCFSYGILCHHRVFLQNQTITILTAEDMSEIAEKSPQ